MRNIIFFLVFIAPIILISVLYSMLPVFDNDSELAQKHEWSVLQSLEYKYRHEKQIGDMLLIQRVNDSNCVVIGLPLLNQLSGYAWLIANPSTEPRVKMLPMGANFRISQKELVHIQNQIQIDNTVLSFLEQHVVN